MLPSCWSWLHCSEGRTPHLCCKTVGLGFIVVKEGLHLCCKTVGLGFIVVKEGLHLCCKTVGLGFIIVKAGLHLCCRAVKAKHTIVEPGATNAVFFCRFCDLVLDTLFFLVCIYDLLLCSTCHLNAKYCAKLNAWVDHTQLHTLSLLNQNWQRPCVLWILYLCHGARDVELEVYG